MHPPIVIRPLAAAEAAAIARWCYPPPYDVYNDEGDGAGAEGPESLEGRYALVQGGELVGFCSFGQDGRVPGGHYPDGPLDVGMGMRPDLTGRGAGGRYLAAVLDFALDQLGATRLRATVAEFNARALRMCERAGFRRVAAFENRERGYWILERDA